VKRHAPAAERNREPILEVLTRALPPRGVVLEIASGTGQHAAFFASRLGERNWQPSDKDPEALASIHAYRDEAGLSNLHAPLLLDVRRERWDEGLTADAIVSINMIHIAPWEACVGLFEGAKKLLAQGAPLYLYGPFRFEGRFTTPSNEAFDASLRAMDASFGVRDLAEVTRVAEEHGFTRTLIVDMPANNHSLVFRRS